MWRTTFTISFLSAVLLVVVPRTAKSGSNEVENVLVKLPADGGTISGVSFVSPGGGPQYYAFKGIPYAKPPTGNLRFKAPQPYGSIEGTLVADRDGSICPQMDTKANIVIGDEDCLKLNVFTHQKPSKGAGATKYPVIVIIHDGGFQGGSSSSDIYNPRRFLDREIIVVTFNYRLGVLGFLSTNDDMSPGNYGLLDQVEALRWIQKNIGTFGGDVHQVTLFGYEAGAASGLYHLISPLSKGLFHRVIALSGSPVCDSSLQKNPMDWAKQFGTDSPLDCYVHETRALINCLRKRSVDEIITTAHKLHTLGGHYPFTFLPAVERVFKENGDFLPDTPVNLLKEGKVNKVPVILGVGAHKGKQLFQDVFAKNADNKEEFFRIDLPELLKITTHIKYHHKEIGEAVKKVYYTQESHLNDERQFKNITVEMFNDYLVRSCVDLTAKYLSQSGWPTYLYTVDSPALLDHEYPDELQYLFEGSGGLRGESPEDEMKIRRIILGVWSNFAKTSMPTPNKSPDLPLTWTPLNPGKVRYLKISANSSLVEGSVNKQISFWNTKVPKIETGQHKKDEL